MSSSDRALADIRDDLTDGEDLSLAARLIGDTLGRRMRRARRLLAELDEHEGGPDHDRLDHLRRRADEVESQLEQVSARFGELSEAFESELSDLADSLGADGDVGGQADG